jgi:hypothetical protein
MNSEPTDVAAGEKYRAYDKRIGAERYALAIQRKNGAVVQGFQQFVPELRHNHFFDELVAELTAAAMGKNDLVVIRNGQRTRSSKK